VEIASDGHAAAGEGFVERVRRGAGRVLVELLLADGSGAVALLDAHDWDWLELSAGDIVPVRCVGRRCVGRRCVSG
jgi:hypothetical protein